MAHAIRVLQRPRQRLHAAQAAAQHGRQLRDAQAIEQARLGVDPVLHCHHRKVCPVHLAGIGVDVHGPGRAKAGAEVVDADDEEFVGIDRLARPDHVVPPALALGLAFVAAGYMVRCVERMAHQNGVGPVGVQLAIGFESQVVIADGSATFEGERLREMH
ncbi:hypothetical protein D3C72_1756300 [compost metagenome]